MVKKKPLPTRTFKMKEEEDIRTRSRKVLNVALFLKEIGFAVRNYCSLSDDMAKLHQLDPDPDKGLIEVKKVDEEDLKKILEYLEKREIEVIETFNYIFEDKLEVTRIIIKISSIKI